MEFKSQRFFLGHLLLPIHPACYHNRKRKSLMVQGEFGKIIDVGMTELCFLTV
jgi:hypothetical protein